MKRWIHANTTANEGIEVTFQKWVHTSSRRSMPIRTVRFYGETLNDAFESMFDTLKMTGTDLFDPTYDDYLPAISLDDITDHINLSNSNVDEFQNDTILKVQDLTSGDVLYSIEE